MATRNWNEDLKRLTELDNYKIEPGDPDPRGWAVLGPGGDRVGRVTDLLVDTRAMKVRHLLVDLEGTSGAGSGEVLLDAREVNLHHDRREVRATRLETGDVAAGGGYAHGEAYAGRSSTEEDRTTLTRSEEELEIGKREVSRGEARIGKHVETERISEPVTRRREELVVERRPVEAGSRSHADIRDDEVRIPLMEEEVTVEKRPVVKEELVVGKRVVEERDTVEADVRREEFDIEKDGTTRGNQTRRRDR